MNVRNIHERLLSARPVRVGALLDSLSSKEDALWPRRWPPMWFDRPLGVGAVGGHGPIRYYVEAYEPGRRVRFRFTGPRGFHGMHECVVEPVGERRARLRHVIEMRTSGLALLSWPLVYRPLHDALIEDLLDRAEEQVGMPPCRSRWSLWVKILRRVLS